MENQVNSNVEYARIALESVIDMLDDIAEDIGAGEASSRIQVMEYAIQGIIDRFMTLPE